VWACDYRLLIDRQCGAMVFLVSYLIINCIIGHALDIGPPITTLYRCPTATQPREYCILYSYTRVLTRAKQKG